MKLAVPKTLADIPLKAYQKFIAIENPTEEQTLQYLLGVDRDVLRALKGKSVAKLSKHLESLFKRQFNLERFFTIDGVEYGFEPDLDNATYGVVNDAEMFLPDPQEGHRAMAVLYRPVLTKNRRDKYLIEKYEPGKYDEVMKNAPVSAYLGMQVFFYRLTIDLLKHTRSYIKEALTPEVEQQILEQSGVDTNSFLQYQEGIFSNLIEQANSISMPV